MPKHAPFKEHDEFKYNRVPTLRSFYSRDGTPPSLRKRPPAPTPTAAPAALAAHVLRPRPTYMASALALAPPAPDPPRPPHLDMRCFLEQLYLQRGYPYHREEPQFDYYILPSDSRDPPPPTYPREVVFDSYPAANPVIHREYRIPNILERGLREEWPNVDRYGERSDEAKLLQSSVSSRSDGYEYTSPRRKRKLRVKRKKRHRHDENEMEKRQGWYPKTISRRRAIGARKTVRSNNSTRIYECMPGSKTTIDESLGLDSDARMLLTEYESVTISSKDMARKHHRTHSSSRRRSSFNKEQGGKVIFIETDFSSISKGDSSTHSCHRKNTVPAITKEIKKKNSPDSETPDSAFCSRNKTSPSSNNISKEEIREIFVDQKKHAIGTSVTQAIERRQQSFTSPLYKPQDVVCTRQKVEEMGVVIEEQDQTELQEKNNELQSPLSVLQFSYIMPESEQEIGGQYVPAIQSEPNLTVISGNEISNYWNNAVKTAKGSIDRQKIENLHGNGNILKGRISSNELEILEQNLNNLASKTHDCMPPNIATFTHETDNGKTPFKSENKEVPPRAKIEQIIIPQNFAESQNVAEPQNVTRSLPTKLLFDDFERSICKEADIDLKTEECSNQANNNKLDIFSDQKTRAETIGECEKVLEIIDLTSVDPAGIVTEKKENVVLQPSQNVTPSSNASQVQCISGDRQELVKINNRVFRICEGNTFQEVPCNVGNQLEENKLTHQDVQLCEDSVTAHVLSIEVCKNPSDKNCSSDHLDNSSNYTNPVNNLASIPWTSTRTKLTHSPQIIELKNEPTWEKNEQPSLESIAGELVISTHEPSTFSLRTRTISEPAGSVCDIITCSENKHSTLLSDETNLIPMNKDIEGGCQSLSTNVRDTDNATENSQPRISSPEQHSANNISGFKGESENTVLKKTLAYRGNKTPLKILEKDKISELQNKPLTSTESNVAIEISELPLENVNIPIRCDTHSCTTLDAIPNLNVVVDRHFESGESQKAVNFSTTIGVQHTLSVEKVLVVSDMKEQTFRIKGPNNNFPQGLQRLYNAKKASREYINVSQHIFKCPLMHAVNCSDINSTRASDSSIEISSQTSSTQTSVGSTPPTRKFRSLCSGQSCNEAESSSSSHFSKEETPSANVSVSSIESQNDSTVPGIMIWEMCNKKMYRDNDVTMFMRASAGEMFMERHPFANISNDIINSNDIEFSSEKSILPSITEERSSRVLKGSIEELSPVKQEEGESVVGLLQQIVRHLSCIGRQRSASSCSAQSSHTHHSAENSLDNIRHSGDKIMNAYATISDVHMKRSKSDQMRSIRQNNEVDHQEDLITPALSKNNDLNCPHFNGNKHPSKQNSFEKCNVCKAQGNVSLTDGGTYSKCTSETVENDNFHKHSNKNLSHILSTCDLHREYLNNRDIHSLNATSENPCQITLNNAVNKSKLDLNISSKHSNDSINVTLTENTTVALPSNNEGLTDSLNLSSERNRILCPPSHTSQDREVPETANDGLCTFISPSSPSSTDLERNVKSCLVHCEGKQTSEELKQFRLSGGSSPTADRIHQRRSGKWDICSSGSDRSHQYSARRPSSELRRRFPSRSFRRSSQKHLPTDEGHVAKYLDKYKYSDISEKDIRKSSKSRRTHRFPTYISRAKGDERDAISGSRKFYTRDSSDSSNESSRTELPRSRTGSCFESIPEYPYSSSSDEPSQRRTRRCCKRRDQGLGKSAKRCISCILKNIPTLTSHLILNENNFESENSIARRSHSVGGKSNIRALYAQTYAKPNLQVEKQLPKVEEYLKIEDSPSSPVRRKSAYSASAHRSSATEKSFSSNDPTSMASGGILDEMKLCIDRIEERCIKIEKNYRGSSEKSSRSLSPRSGYHRRNTASPTSLSQPQPPTMAWSADERSFSTTNSEGNSSVPRHKIADEENTCAFHRAIKRKLKPFSQVPSEHLFAIDCGRRLSQSTQAEFKKPEYCEMGVGTEIARKCKYCEMKTQTDEFKLYEKGIQVIIEEMIGVAMATPVKANKYKDPKRNLRDSCVQWEYPEEELRQISLGMISEMKHELCDSSVQCTIMGHGTLISQSSQTDFKVHRCKSVQSDSINLVESGIQMEVTEMTSRGVQANAPTESSVQVLKKKDSFSQTLTMNEVFFVQEVRPASRPMELVQCDRGYQQGRNSCRSEPKCITCPERSRDREGPDSQGPGGPGRSGRSPGEYEPSGQDGRQKMPRFRMCKRCEGVNPPCSRGNSTCPNTYLVDDATQRRIEERMRDAPPGGADPGRYKDLVCKCSATRPKDEDKAYCRCPKESESYPPQKYPRDDFPSKTTADPYGRTPPDRRYGRPSEDRLYRPPTDDRYGPSPYESYGPPTDDGRYRPPYDRRGYGPSDSQDFARPPPDSKGYGPPPREADRGGELRDYAPSQSDDERGYGPPPTEPRGYGPPPKEGRDYGPSPYERDYRPSETKRYQPPPDERDYGKRPRDAQYYDTRPSEAQYYEPPRGRNQLGPPPRDSRAPPQRDGYDSPRDGADQPPTVGRYGPPPDDRQSYQPSQSYRPSRGDTKQYAPPRDRRPPEEDDLTHDVSDRGDKAYYGRQPDDIRQGDRRGQDDDQYPPPRDSKSYSPPREQMPSGQSSADDDYPPGRGSRHPSRGYSERDSQYYPQPSDGYPPPRSEDRDKWGGPPTREQPPNGRGSTAYDPQKGAKDPRDSRYYGRKDTMEPPREVDSPDRPPPPHSYGQPPESEESYGEQPDGKPSGRPPSKRGVSYVLPPVRDPDETPPDRDGRYKETPLEGEPYDRDPDRDPYERPPDRDIRYRSPSSQREPYDRAPDRDGRYKEPPPQGEPYDRDPGRDPYERPPDRDIRYRSPSSQREPYDRAPDREGRYKELPPQGEPYDRDPGRDPYERPPDRDIRYRSPSSQREPYDRAPDRDGRYKELPPQGEPYDRDPGRDPYERPPDRDIRYRSPSSQREPYDRAPDREGRYKELPPQGEPYDRDPGRDPYERPPDRDIRYRSPSSQREPYDRAPDREGRYKELPPQGEPYDRDPGRDPYERPPDRDIRYRSPSSQREPYDRAPDRDGRYKEPPPQGEPYDRDPGRDPYERPPDRDIRYRSPSSQREPYDRAPDREGRYKELPPQGEPYDRDPGRDPYERPPDRDIRYRSPSSQREPYDRAPDREGRYKELPPQGEPYDRDPGRDPYERPPDRDIRYRSPSSQREPYDRAPDREGRYKELPPQGEPYDRDPGRDPYERPPDRDIRYRAPSSQRQPYDRPPDRDGPFREPSPYGESHDRAPGRDPYAKPRDGYRQYKGPSPQGEPYERAPGRDPYERQPDGDGPYRGHPSQGELYDRSPGRSPYGRQFDRDGPYRGPPPQGEPSDTAPGRSPYERPPYPDDPYGGRRTCSEPFEKDPYRQAPPGGDPNRRPLLRSAGYERPPPRGETPPGGKRPGEPVREPYARSRPPSSEPAYAPEGERVYGPLPRDEGPWRAAEPRPSGRDPRALDDEKELRVWSPADRSRPESARPREDEDRDKPRKQKRKGFWRCFRRKPRRAKDDSSSQSPTPDSPPPESRPPSRSSRSRPQSGPPSRQDRRQDDDFERGSSRPPSAPPRTENPPDDRTYRDTSPCDMKCEQPSPPPRDSSRDPNEPSLRSRKRSQDPYEDPYDYPKKKEKKKGKRGGGSSSSSSSDRSRYQPSPPGDSYRDSSSRRRPYDDSRPSRRYSSPHSEEKSDRNREPKTKKKKSERKKSKTRSSRRDSRDTYDSLRDRSQDPYDYKRPCDPSECPSSGREPPDGYQDPKKKECGRQRSKHRTPRRDSRDSYSYDSPRSPSDTTTRPSRPRRRDSYDDSRTSRRASYSGREPLDSNREPNKDRRKCGRQRAKHHSPRRDSRDPYDSSYPARDRSKDTYDSKRPRQDSYDSSDIPCDSTRSPRDSSRPPCDSSREPYDSSRRDKYREPYDSSYPRRSSPEGSLCVLECKETDGTRQPQSEGSRLVCVNDPARYQSGENVILCDDLHNR